jgi:hypothetical protein
LLNNEEKILALYKEIGGVEKAIQDRPQQDAKRRLLHSEAEQRLRVYARTSRLPMPTSCGR